MTLPSVATIMAMGSLLGAGVLLLVKLSPDQASPETGRAPGSLKPSLAN
jgi:hypothetical protein